MVRVVVLLLSLVVLALPLRAEDEGPMRGKLRERIEDFRKTCGPDVQKYCKGTGAKDQGIKRQQAVMDCLVGHLDATDPSQALSAGCKPMVANAKGWRAKMEAIKAACAGDVDKLCPNGKDHPMLCLINNRAKLSPGCSSALPKRGEGPGGKMGGPGGQ